MYIVGLDLGQTRDYSALCVVERTPGRRRWQYGVRHLHRWALGTPYPDIVDDVRRLLHRAPLDPDESPLIVDRTGVGRAIADLFRVGGIRPHGVTITGGMDANLEDHFDLKVPKREVISSLIACFQTERLKVAARLPLARDLLGELATMRVKVNLSTTNESYEHWRESDKDDIALAVGLAVWWGEHMAGEFAVDAAIPPALERGPDPGGLAGPLGEIREWLGKLQMFNADPRAQRTRPAPEPEEDAGDQEESESYVGMTGNPLSTSSTVFGADDPRAALLDWLDQRRGGRGG